MTLFSNFKSPALLALTLAFAGNAQALVIQFNTNTTSGSCFANTFDDVNSGCQAAVGKPVVTFNNVQGDSASITWTGFTSSVGFAGGPLQPVNYGSFDLVYTPNGADTTPVAIPQTSFLMIIKETSPSPFTYQTILVDLTGLSGNAGSIATGAVDLEATFSPLEVSNNTSTTNFFVSPGTQVLNGLGTNGGKTNISGQAQDVSAPEPSSWLLLSVGLAGFLFLSNRHASDRNLRVIVPNTKI